MGKYTHLIDLDDLSRDVIEEIVRVGEQIADNPQHFAAACKNKVMATLFYEPSTRTQMSFQAAMLRLGGTIIGFDNPETSSVAKGENLKDTTKVVTSYADIMVMRNPREGSAKAAALTAECPVINAGDGGHLHPTQTLTDLLTIQAEKKRIDNLTIGLCGDLKYGRTVHSLCKAMAKFPNNRFALISTPELTLPDYIKSFITKNHCEIKEYASIEEAMPELDIIYMTRIQKERFTAESAECQNNFILDAEKMKLAKEDLIVLHPLPRVDEITIDVDDDPRAKYFMQAKYGVYVRMAIILITLENRYPQKLLSGIDSDKLICTNPKCVTRTEGYLPKRFLQSESGYVCEYCEQKAFVTDKDDIQLILK
ncbi:MAG: aspartate carbamoyltransferase [Ruminococcus sp.]|jgi:aspartate carbamoyltransferase catalytic subunit|nr:aspartate carbamoyltransferase [Ruminococcus sp.]